MNTFEKICEKYGVIKTTKKMMYPRQIKFSESFLKTLKHEFFTQKLNEESGEIKNHAPKFLKALQFHIKEFEDNAAVGLEETKRYSKHQAKSNAKRREELAKRLVSKIKEDEPEKEEEVEEGTEPYVAKVEGEPQEGDKDVGLAAQAKRREEVEDENISMVDMDLNAAKQLEAEKDAQKAQPTKEGKKKYNLTTEGYKRFYPKK